jgi:hypothetical protein
MKELMNHFLTHIFALFKPIDSATLAEMELAEARREKLRAESAVEFATAILEYNNKRVKRLEARVQAQRSKQTIRAVAA